MLGSGGILSDSSLRNASKNSPVIGAGLCVVGNGKRPRGFLSLCMSFQTTRIKMILMGPRFDDGAHIGRTAISPSGAVRMKAPVNQSMQGLIIRSQVRSITIIRGFNVFCIYSKSWARKIARAYTFSTISRHSPV